MALAGTSFVVSSMCQLNVPLRYSAAGFFDGSRLTLKISWPPGARTVPSLRLIASWASSSRCRPRISNTPRHLSASRHRAITVSSSASLTPITSAPSPGPSAIVSTIKVPFGHVPQVHHNGFGGGKGVERLVSLFPAISGFLETTERQLHSPACPLGVDDRKVVLQDRLAAAGAQRLCRLGTANAHVLGSPHDAMYPLQRLVHWMADDDIQL